MRTLQYMSKLPNSRIASDISILKNILFFFESLFFLNAKLQQLVKGINYPKNTNKSGLVTHKDNFRSAKMTLL